MRSISARFCGRLGRGGREGRHRRSGGGGAAGAAGAAGAVKRVAASFLLVHRLQPPEAMLRWTHQPSTLPPSLHEPHPTAPQPSPGSTHLRVGGVVDAALQHAAAVAVRGNVQAVGGGRVVDELAVLGAQPLRGGQEEVEYRECANCTSA